jgi:hypothetical protein
MQPQWVVTPGKQTTNNITFKTTNAKKFEAERQY